MINDLILFCGGSPLFGQGKPKPLSVLPNSLTLLETFLRLPPLRNFERINVVTEDDYVPDTQKIVKSVMSELGEINLITSPNASSTLEKMVCFLSICTTGGPNLLFTYPDIFLFGSWQRLLLETDLESRMKISGVLLQSRFPEIHYDPYGTRVRSIGVKARRIQANKSTIYGGHFCSTRSLLESNLELFRRNFTETYKPSLEGDFFKFLVSKGILDVEILNDRWIKADSAKEINEIISKM